MTKPIILVKICYVICNPGVCNPQKRYSLEGLDGYYYCNNHHLQLSHVTVHVMSTNYVYAYSTVLHIQGVTNI